MQVRPEEDFFIENNMARETRRRKFLIFDIWLDTLITYIGSKVYTEAPPYETIPMQYMQLPEQHRLNTAKSSSAQLTPQPISEIRHIINKVTTGTQTQPLGIANLEEIKTLIKKYSDMKDIIVNSLLSELVKNKNVKREDIENIKRLSSTFTQPFTARSYKYAQNPNVIQKMAKYIEMLMYLLY